MKLTLSDAVLTVSDGTKTYTVGKGVPANPHPIGAPKMIDLIRRLADLLTPANGDVLRRAADAHEALLTGWVSILNNESLEPRDRLQRVSAAIQMLLFGGSVPAAHKVQAGAVGMTSDDQLAALARGELAYVWPLVNPPLYATIPVYLHPAEDAEDAARWRWTCEHGHAPISVKLWESVRAVLDAGRIPTKAEMDSFIDAARGA